MIMIWGIKLKLNNVDNNNIIANLLHGFAEVTYRYAGYNLLPDKSSHPEQNTPNI